jgi:hypothetical protein
MRKIVMRERKRKRWKRELACLNCSVLVALCAKDGGDNEREVEVREDLTDLQHLRQSSGRSTFPHADH